MASGLCYLEDKNHVCKLLEIYVAMQYTFHWNFLSHWNFINYTSNILKLISG